MGRRGSRLVARMPEREEPARSEHPMDEPDPERQHRSCGGPIDNARGHQPELMTTIREQGATGGEDVAAPIGVGAVDEAHDETLARRLREHRCVVRAPGPAADMVHDGDRERPRDAKNDRVEDSAVDPGHEPPATATRASSEEVRSDSGRDHGEGAGGQCCHDS